MPPERKQPLLSSVSISRSSMADRSGLTGIPASNKADSSEEARAEDKSETRSSLTTRTRTDHSSDSLCKLLHKINVFSNKFSGEEATDTAEATTTAAAGTFREEETTAISATATRATIKETEVREEAMAETTERGNGETMMEDMKTKGMKTPEERDREEMTTMAVVETTDLEEMTRTSRWTDLSQVNSSCLDFFHVLPRL